MMHLLVSIFNYDPDSLSGNFYNCNHDNALPAPTKIVCYGLELTIIQNFLKFHLSGSMSQSKMLF